jgi:hypothetical protein
VDLTRPEIEIRPRTQWEAADLGCLMARRWFAPLLASWFVTALPVFALAVLMTGFRPVLALLVFWWFKPLYERLPLSILSQVIFGGVQAPAGDWRRILLPQLGATLSYRRLSLTRSFDAPVAVLEQLSGPARARRLAVLHRDAGGPALWLTVLCAHIEAFLLLGLLALIGLLMPEQLAVDWQAIAGGDAATSVLWMLCVLYAVVTAMTCPVYVAAGFSLYLHRRIELEAWDVELGFRHLLERWRRLHGAATAVMVVVIAGGAISLALPAMASPGTSEPAMPRPHAGDEFIWQPGADTGVERRPATEQRYRTTEMQRSGREIDAVLAGPEFNETIVVSYPSLLRRWQERQRGAAWSGAVSTIAVIGRLLLWALALALALWLLVNAWRWSERGTGDDAHTPQPRVLGQDLDDGGTLMPRDVLVQARAHWGARHPRDAIGLLLRASLQRLKREHGCRLIEGDTESDCLRKARTSAPAEVIGYLERLVAAWQRLAYAHRTLDDAAFDDLCDRWPRQWR